LTALRLEVLSNLSKLFLREGPVLLLRGVPIIRRHCKSLQILVRFSQTDAASICTAFSQIREQAHQEDNNRSKVRVNMSSVCISENGRSARQRRKSLQTCHINSDSSQCKKSSSTKCRCLDQPNDFDLKSLKPDCGLELKGASNENGSVRPSFDLQNQRHILVLIQLLGKAPQRYLPTATRHMLDRPRSAFIFHHPLFGSSDASDPHEGLCISTMRKAS
jgi:hypothetical protein